MSSAAALPRTRWILSALLALLLVSPSPEARAWLDTVGGDDVLISTDGNISKPDMLIAPNGDVYVCATEADEGYVDGLKIRRSRDGGVTWELWGEVPSSGSGLYGSMVIAGSAPEILFVAYRKTGGAVHVAGSNTALATAVFGDRMAIDVPGETLYDVDLATDAVNYANYNLYVTAATPNDGADVWFARSTDKGNSWEPAYTVITSSHSPWTLRKPELAYGFGGYVHLVCEFSAGGDPDRDPGVYYRRASNRGTGGGASWGAVMALASTTDDVWQRWPEVVASDDSPMVLVIHTDSGQSTVRLSKDQGASWNPASAYPIASGFDFDAVKIPGGGSWVLGMAVTSTDEFAVLRAPDDDPSDWVGPLVLNDRPYDDHVAEYNPVAFDPTRGNRAAMVWSFEDHEIPDSLFFDAEWHGDPGYPNFEEGFPLDLDVLPVVAPALVDVSGDARLEIVFGDQDGHVFVYDCEGQMAPGWPRDVGTFPGNGSIAVGDLNGDGEPVVVAGNDSGRIYAWNGAGELQQGWPIDLGVTADVHLAIGSLGPPYARYVVACASNRMWVINYAGRIMTGYPRVFSDIMVGPPAIGDVDDDGVNEIVTVKNEWIHVHEHGKPTADAYRNVPGASFRGRPSLGDLDLDGDLEIVVPTEVGKVYVLEHDLSDRTGWPFDHGSSYAISNVALADNLFDDRLELAFSAQNYTVHLVYEDGDEQSAYPKHTGTGWWLWGAPIIDDVNRTSANVLVAARDRKAWTWTNTGSDVLAWPKSLDTQVELGPASGDIDLDGRNEIVLVGNTQLVVLDVNQPPASVARDRWSMDGHDPQRTGCAACVEPQVTAAPVEGQPTTVRFRAPHPNPTSSSVNLSVDIPRPSAVEIGVYDVRGRRVRELLKREVQPGPLLLPWDGRDARGGELASGAYFVRLRVRSGDRDETLTRKVLLVR